MLLDLIANRRRCKASRGELIGSPTPVLAELAGPEPTALAPVPARAEQSNSSIVYDDKLGTGGTGINACNGVRNGQYGKAFVAHVKEQLKLG